jgi:hypothetical protein
MAPFFQREGSLSLFSKRIALLSIQNGGNPGEKRLKG